MVSEEGEEKEKGYGDDAEEEIVLVFVLNGLTAKTGGTGESSFMNDMAGCVVHKGTHTKAQPAGACAQTSRQSAKDPSFSVQLRKSLTLTRLVRIRHTKSITIYYVHLTAAARARRRH
jgi:hypothetical protein